MQCQIAGIQIQRHGGSFPTPASTKAALAFDLLVILLPMKLHGIEIRLRFLAILAGDPSSGSVEDTPWTAFSNFLWKTNNNWLVVIGDGFIPDIVGQSAGKSESAPNEAWFGDKFGLLVGATLLVSLLLSTLWLLLAIVLLRSHVGIS